MGFNPYFIIREIPMSKEESTATLTPVATKAGSAPNRLRAQSSDAAPFFSFLDDAGVDCIHCSMLAAATATARFMFPNVLFEPPPTFKAGFPNEIQVGQVDERFKQRFAVWLVRRAFDQYANAAGILRVVHGLHPSGLHAELAGSRTEIQVPVPRQRLLQNRRQF